MSRDLWKIVGGVDKGGILVREGESVKSPMASERLSTEAIVAQLALQGDRLNYELLSGTGPKNGWISTRLKDNELAIRMVETEAELFPASEAVATVELDRYQVAPEIQARCRRECESPPIKWQRVDQEWVVNNHKKVCKGMFYNLVFPWNEEMLLDYGAEWLTRAFQQAGTLEPDNSVTEIVHVKKHEFGNNGGKTLFQVRYKKPSPNLHEKLFAKYPFDMEDKKQFSDSVAQRVYKQPQDFTEGNFSRLMEMYIPFKTPKFYFGDISNENTNFILITEQIAFDDPGTEEPLKPFQIEGPYDKAMDWKLRGSAHEYYYLLVKKGAIMAALSKTGKLAPANIIDQFENTATMDKDKFGLQAGISGDPYFQQKLDQAEKFMFQIAYRIFPEAVQKSGFRDKWRRTMLMVNAYQAESYYYRHRAFPDYTGFTHQNLNVDNAFFWRDDKGELDCGIFDWGNQRTMGVAHMFYWWVYVSEWDMLKEHLQGLLDCFCNTFEQYGGPKLDRKRFRRMYLLTALDHNTSLVPTIPLMYKMCSKKEFEKVTSRFDERIFKAIDGKSTTRVYLHCWSSIVHMFEEWNIGEEFEKWLEEVCNAPLSFHRKSINDLYK